MSYADELNPSDSVLAFYATDLRRKREMAGMTQRALAQQALMAPSLLNKIEAAKRLPSEDLSKVADRLFGTDDHFIRLWPLTIKYAYPAWFRPYVELEASATKIRSFEAQVVPGLLQTEEYARVVLSAGRPDVDKVEELVVGRLDRQRIFARKNRPELWTVLDESVIRRRMGGVDTMRSQLEALLSAAQTPKIVLQIMPYSAGCHAGVGGPFSALTLDEGQDVVYVEGFMQGQILAEQEHLEAAAHTYDLLRAEALSPNQSIDLIADALKELRP